MSNREEKEISNQIVLYLRNSTKPVVISTDEIDVDNYYEIKKCIRDDQILTIKTEYDIFVVRGSDIGGVMLTFESGCPDIESQEQEIKTESADQEQKLTNLEGNENYVVIENDASDS